MTSRLVPALLLLAAVPVAAAVAAVPAGAAGAAPGIAPKAAVECASTKIMAVTTSSDSVSVGTKKTKSVDLDIAVSRACASTKVVLTVSSPGKTRTFTADKVDRVTGVGLDGASVDVTYYTVGIDLEPKRLETTDAGSWHTSAELTTDNGSTTKQGPDFTVRHATRTTFDVKPDTVRKGKYINLVGRLSQADWATQKYVPKPHDELVLQWRPKGDSHFRDLTPLAVDDGAYWGSPYYTVSGSGCFRAVYAGTTTLAPTTSRTDCVRVK